MTGRVPTSTYRLQVGPDLDLFAAARLLPYLHDLGVDWVYLSPLLEAEPGSSHGYDVVDHTRVDPARGGAEGLAAVSAEARRLGLGVLVDLVPNHMGVATPAANAAWWDLLTHGRDSAYASWFDVDWESGADDVRGKVLVPVVGEGDEGSIVVGPDAVTYHEHRFPLAPGTSTLAEQHYALVDWRRGDAELNYRRFFTVTTLAGVRVEDPAVLDATHAEVRRWFDEGLVDGLRIDHPDGLRDPGGYLDDLARLTGSAYTLVEKILEDGETLPTTWATAGTTGYDVLGWVDRLLTEPAGIEELERLDWSLRGVPDGQRRSWDGLVHDAKRAVADGALLAETRRIVRELPAGVGDRLGAAEAADAVAEVLACFPVYRSYLPQGRDHLETALRLAEQHRPDLADPIAALAPVLRDPEQPAARRFQQTSGMVMAKGVEDSAFYRWSVLTSLNEVGGDPSHTSLDRSDFDDLMTARQATWPHAMTTLSTHDTKRSEDVRARITGLAEAPDAWAGALGRLLEIAPLPDPGFGNLLWQAAFGAWPLSRERLHAYAEKAMREAGDRTTWTDPDEEYERAVHAAVDAAYDVPEATAVLDGLVERLAGAGHVNALSAKLLSLTLPGVPDVYQGTELIDLSLVDPDNRRPVDVARRMDLLEALRTRRQPDADHGRDDPDLLKLVVVHRALTLRRDRPDLFTTYRPLTADGPAGRHLVAFDRGGAVPLATRFPVGLATDGGWRDTVVHLPDGRWTNLLGDTAEDHGPFEGTVPVREVLLGLPVALLVREDRRG